jgi:hypothetical protein
MNSKLLVMPIEEPHYDADDCDWHDGQSPFSDVDTWPCCHNCGKKYYARLCIGCGYLYVLMGATERSLSNYAPFDLDEFGEASCSFCELKKAKQLIAERLGRIKKRKSCQEGACHAPLQSEG